MQLNGNNSILLYASKSNSNLHLSLTHSLARFIVIQPLNFINISEWMLNTAQLLVYKQLISTRHFFTDLIFFLIFHLLFSIYLLFLHASINFLSFENLISIISSGWIERLRWRGLLIRDYNLLVTHDAIDSILPNLNLNSVISISRNEI